MLVEDGTLEATSLVLLLLCVHTVVKYAFCVLFFLHLQKSGSGSPAQVVDVWAQFGLVTERSPQGLCSICLEDFDQESKVVNLGCKHSFHDVCIRNWLSKRASCPQCRRRAKSANLTISEV